MIIKLYNNSNNNNTNNSNNSFISKFADSTEVFNSESREQLSLKYS